MKNEERFSNRVNNYSLYRPHYPEEVIPFLTEKSVINFKSVVADIGSGTGISSEIFIKNGNQVFGVEPNKEMRRAAEKHFKGNKLFISIEGSAEETTLASSSIDLIVVGQALHWFDKIKSKNEFQRISRKKASLVLMWNDRDLKSPLQQEYEALLRDYAVDYKELSYRNISEETLKEYFLPNSFSMKVFDHAQHFDLEGFKGRLLSSSYAPLANDPRYKPMVQNLEQIFKKYSRRTQVTFKYNCKVYFGELDNWV